MSECYDNQKKSNSSFRELLREHLGQCNPRRKELTAEETKRLRKLEAIADKTKRGDNVQNRQLQIWLSDDEYAAIDAEWQEQLALRNELKDNSSDLKRYEEKLKPASFNYNRAEGNSGDQNHTMEKIFARTVQFCVT